MPKVAAESQLGSVEQVFHQRGPGEGNPSRPVSCLALSPRWLLHPQLTPQAPCPSYAVGAPLPALSEVTASPPMPYSELDCSAERDLFSFLPQGARTDCLPFDDCITTPKRDLGRTTEPTHLGEWYIVSITLVPDPHVFIPLLMCPFIHTSIQ